MRSSPSSRARGGHRDRRRRASGRDGALNQPDVVPINRNSCPSFAWTARSASTMAARTSFCGFSSGMSSNRISTNRGYTPVLTHSAWRDQRNRAAEAPRSDVPTEDRPCTRLRTRAWSPGRAGSGARAVWVGKCIHPSRARYFAHSLRTISCGMFAGYRAFESPFNELAATLHLGADLRVLACSPNGI